MPKDASARNLVQKVWAPRVPRQLTRLQQQLVQLREVPDELLALLVAWWPFSGCRLHSILRHKPARACINVGIRACVHICMCVCACIHVCAWVCVRVCMCACVGAYVHAWVLMCMRGCLCACVRTQLHMTACVCDCMRPCVHLHVCTCIHACRRLLILNFALAHESVFVYM